MNLFFSNPHTNTGEGEPGEHTLVTDQETHHSTTEGSEFLDDAIRMVEQQLGYKEENVQPDVRKTDGSAQKGISQ